MKTMTKNTTKKENPDQYEGWANRETWAVSLWLNNDRGLYDQLQEIKTANREKWEAKAEEAEGAPELAEVVASRMVELADTIKEFVEELADTARTSTENDCGMLELRSMMDDIGSRWRVEWLEIAKSETADEMLEKRKPVVISINGEKRVFKGD